MIQGPVTTMFKLKYYNAIREMLITLVRNYERAQAFIVISLEIITVAVK